MHGATRTPEFIRLDARCCVALADVPTLAINGINTKRRNLIFISKFRATNLHVSSS
jgi:hypothetical protein